MRWGGGGFLLPEQVHSSTRLSLDISRLTWLVRARWGVLIVALLLVAILSYWDILSSLDCMAGTIAVLGVLNLVFYKSLHHEPFLTPVGIPVLCLIQILADILGILALIHFAGGLTNPFLFILVAPIFVSGIFFQARWTYVLAALALGCAALLGLFETRGWLDHYPLSLIQASGDAVQVHHRMSVTLVALGCVLAACAYLSIQVMGALKKREWYLGRLQESLQSQQRERNLGTGQRRKALTGLAEGIEREVKNPLGIIRARVDALHYSIEDLSNPDDSLQQDLDVISSKVDQIEKTVEQISMVFQQGSGQRESVDLDRLLRESAEAMRGTLQDRGIAFHFSPSIRLAPILGNAQELKELFRLILENALEAVDGAEGSRISLRMRVLPRDPGLAVVRVRDNGPGIPPDFQKHIFDPFYSTRGKDRGLGLPRAYTLARNHGGELRVRSRPPPGTVVMVLLPLAPDERI